QHHRDREQDGGDHHRRLVGHADRRDDRVEREHDVDHRDLRDDTHERDRRLAVDVLGFFLADDQVLDLGRPLHHQEHAAQDQHQVADGDAQAEEIEQLRGQSGQPRQRQQQADTGYAGDRDAELARLLALHQWQLAHRDRDEYQVVDAQHDLDRAQGDQGDPGLRVGEQFNHVQILGKTGFGPPSGKSETDYRTRGNRMAPHTSSTFIISTKTAAEPMSLARPASSWNSGP